MQRLTGRNIHHFHGHNFNLVNGFRHILLYSTASSSTSSKTDSFANYLVDSLGFSHQQALSASTKLSKTNTKVNLSKPNTNANSVVGFFKTHGLDDTLLIQIISRNPRLLSCNVDKGLKPKFDFFRNAGFSQSDIVRFISTNPDILSMGLEFSIMPAFHVLRQILVSDSQVVDVLKRSRRWSLGGIVNNLRPNVSLLSSYGIPIELIRKHLVMKPTSFFRKPESFKEMVSGVEHKLGISRDSLLFLYGIHIGSSFSKENIESKFQTFKSFGWTRSDVETFIMKNPSCFTFSDESIKKKLEFLVNELRLEPAYLTASTGLLTCSLEKRVVPRHKVLHILKEKGLLKKYPSLGAAVKISEPYFLKKFVIPFKEVHRVYEQHTGCNIKMLTQESVDIHS